MSSLDMLILFGTVAMIVVWIGFVIPHFSRSRSRASRSSCINHVKSVGLAMRMFSNDHGDKFPWQVRTNDGGSLEWAATPQIFRHFAAASNELNTPKILRCPEDTKRAAVPSWEKFSNANLSYFVGLDAKETEPSLIMTGDRHLTGGTLSNRFLRTLTRQSKVGWSSELHGGLGGNIGFADGSAQQLTSAGLQSIVRSNTMHTIRLAVP